MKEIFNTLMPIRESTGLEIDIYSSTGNLLFSTSVEKPCYAYRHHPKEDFTGGLIIDKDADITYFSVNSKDGYIGVIMGSNDVSRNYAVIVSKLIEKTLSLNKTGLNDENALKMFFNRELSAEQAEKVAQSFSHLKNFYLVKFHTNKAKIAEIASVLEAMAKHSDYIVKMDEKSLVYITKSESAYSSVNEFALSLCDIVSQEAGVDFKISAANEAEGADSLSKAYDECVFAYNFGQKLEPKSKIYSYNQFAFFNMICALPKAELDKFFKSALRSDLSTLKDESLPEVAKEYIKNSLNIAKTSKALYMHRNTLSAKLDKIEKATGLNIRRFEDAMILYIFTMMKER